MQKTAIFLLLFMTYFYTNQCSHILITKKVPALTSIRPQVQYNTHGNVIHTDPLHVAEKLNELVMNVNKYVNSFF